MPAKASPQERLFPIAAILSVTTGINLTDDEASISALVGHVTGDCSTCTASLNAEVARSALNAQLPWTEKLSPAEIPEGLACGTSRQADYEAFVRAQAARHGAELPVKPRMQ